jgi:hypothetical protein
MKYLITIMLIALSINAFSLLDANYVVCEDSILSKLVICVNKQIDKGYKPLSGLHMTFDKPTNKSYWFQALLKE